VALRKCILAGISQGYTLAMTKPAIFRGGDYGKNAISF
jgi:hypothetical protein